MLNDRGEKSVSSCASVARFHLSESNLSVSLNKHMFLNCNWLFLQLNALSQELVVSFRSSLNSDYFNKGVADWEPLLEPTNLNFSLCYSLTGYSPLPHDGFHVNLSLAPAIELNITDLMLRDLMRYNCLLWIVFIWMQTFYFLAF